MTAAEIMSAAVDREQEIIALKERNRELVAALESIEKHVTAMGGVCRTDLLAICSTVRREAKAAIANSTQS